MPTHRAEKNADLEFTFPEDLKWEELDRQGVPLPRNWKLVDLVIERDQDILLIEIKDPSHSRSTPKDRLHYMKRLSDNSILAEELTPKARDSYCYQHLMELDQKPFKFVVLLGLDAFELEVQKALLIPFKDRLLGSIQCESDVAWKRKHIADCVVLSVDAWNKNFPSWPVRRLSAVPAV